MRRPAESAPLRDSISDGSIGTLGLAFTLDSRSAFAAAARYGTGRTPPRQLVLDDVEVAVVHIDPADASPCRSRCRRQRDTWPTAGHQTHHVRRHQLLAGIPRCRLDRIPRQPRNLASLASSPVRDDVPPSGSRIACGRGDARSAFVPGTPRAGPASAIRSGLGAGSVCDLRSASSHAVGDAARRRAGGSGFLRWRVGDD